MTLPYIVLILLALLSLVLSSSFYTTDTWWSDLLSNLGTGFVGSIVLYYLIERVQDKMQKDRELPLKRSILLKIAKHFEIILVISAGVDLRHHFIEEDADEQFRIEVIGLRQVINQIGFDTLPSDFHEKFLELIANIQLPSLLSETLPPHLVSEHELQVANEIKELLEMMLALDIDLGFIALENINKKAEGTIERLENTLSLNTTSS